MEVNQITIWLKSTIPGIIILGAIGSLLAALLILLLKKYILHRIVGLILKFFNNFFNWLISPIAKDQARIILKKDPNIAQVYYFFQLAKLIISISVVLFLIKYFFEVLKNSMDNLFRIDILLPLIIFFFFLYILSKSILNISIPLLLDLGGYIREEIKNELKETKKVEQ